MFVDFVSFRTKSEQLNVVALFYVCDLNTFHFSVTHATSEYVILLRSLSIFFDVF